MHPTPWSAQQTFLDQRSHACVVEFPSRTLGFHAAKVQEIEIIGERQCLYDILFDQQDCNVARLLGGHKDLVDLLDEVGSKSRGWFVDQKKLRLGHHLARDREHPSLPT